MLLSLIIPLAVFAQICAAQAGIKHLFAFGSSWTTTSFNVSSWQPSLRGPLGNPPRGQGTVAGGENYVQFLTYSYNTSITFTYDFAVGGAIVNNTIFQSGIPLSLVRQVQTVFEPKYSSQFGTLWTSDQSYFIVWMGDNDVRRIWQDKLNVAAETTLIMQSYWGKLVADLYAKGARNFLIVGVPRQDQSSAILSYGTSEAARYLTVIQEYNRQLAVNMGTFQKNYKGVKTSFYNSSDLMTRIFKNPTGFKYHFNTSAYCWEQTKKSCLWYNDFHTNTTFHEIMAQEMAKNMTASLGF